MIDFRYKNASNMHDSRMKRNDAVATLRQRRRIVANDERRVCIDRFAVTAEASSSSSPPPLLRYLACLQSCCEAEREILAILVHNQLPLKLSTGTIAELFSSGLIPIVVQCLTAGELNDLLRFCACRIVGQIVAHENVEHMNELHRYNFAVKVIASIDTDHVDHYECICAIISSIIDRDNSIYPTFRLELLVQLMNAFARSLKAKTADLVNDIIRVMIDRTEFNGAWSESILPQIYNMITLPTQTDLVLELNLRFLASLTDGYGFRDRTDNIVQYRFVPLLVRLISWPLNVQLAALEVIKNVSKGFDEHILDLLNANLLAALKDILQNSSAKVVRHLALDILSNISGGHRSEVVAIINAGLVPIVIDVMLNGDHKAQLLATWIVNNITNRGGADEIKFIVDCGALGALCKMLPMHDNDIIINTLGALSQILISLRQYAMFRDVINTIEEFDGLSCVERLQQHANADICLLAFEINDSLFFHENYFDGDEIAELQPAANEFQFKFETDDWDSPSAPTLSF